MSIENQHRFRALMNRRCDEFEDEWIAGGAPSLENYLQPEIDPSFKSELFKNLLELEVHYRLKRGEEPTTVQYLTRFPDHAACIKSCLAELVDAQSELPAAPAARNTLSLKNFRHREEQNSSLDTEHSFFQGLLENARKGDASAVGDLLEQHRSYLRLIAEREVGAGLKRDMDRSDLVQQSFLAAANQFGQFDGTTPAEFIAWLTALHRNKIRDEYRRLTSKKRNIQARVEMPAEVEDANAHLPHCWVLESEQGVLLAQALEKLPVKQREVIRLRHLEGWSIDRLSEHLEISRNAVAALVYRGIKQLRVILSENRELKSGSS